MNKKTVRDIDVSGKRVLVRCDFNVPLDDDGKITDENRIIGALPTIKYLIGEGARVILCSHLGRPKGEFNPKFSLKPVAASLSGHLGREVKLSSDVVGESAKRLASSLKDGEVMLLENVRFHAEEEKNAPGFAKELASLAEIFVSDAFGTVHRAHASTEGVAAYLPAVAGFLIEKELNVMGAALADPARPFVAILGGAKVSDKIGVIENLLDKVDVLLIGGGMAYTFIKAKGDSVGTSICEEDKVELAKMLMQKAKEKGVKLRLPCYNVVTKEFAADAEAKVVKSDSIPDGWMGMDIAAETREQFEGFIKDAKTIIWNGPMGVFEFPRFAEGTKAVAKAVANADAVTIIGGGDSAAAARQLGFADRMTHISTGGGASLEFLEGKELPGIACLLDAEAKKKLAAGNWKMNKTPAEAAQFISELKASVKGAASEVLVCPPEICLESAARAAAGTNIGVGAQNMYFEEKGAFTGELSAGMIKSLGISYVIIGHSERRQYFAETNETVNKKVLAALGAGLTPILCVGESLKEREDAVTNELIRLQIKIALRGVSAKLAREIVIAYEPIWAIGTGKTATIEQAGEACREIRACLSDIYDAKTASAIRILYGGSVTAENSAALFADKDIDGCLVGGASLGIESFAAIASA